MNRDMILAAIGLSILALLIVVQLVMPSPKREDATPPNWDCVVIAERTPSDFAIALPSVISSDC